MKKKATRKSGKKKTKGTTRSTSARSKNQATPKTDTKKRASAKKVVAKKAKTSASTGKAKTLSTQGSNESKSSNSGVPASDRASTMRNRNSKADGQQARPGASATSHDPIQFAEEVTKVPKTKLTAKELREFQGLLLEKRAELLGDIERLTDEALRRKIGGQADSSSMPIHMADLGSDNWEQDFTLGLIANEQALIREIDDALRRIEDKTYGICLATHEPIGLARLRAKPWAKYCIEYARAREEGRAR